MQIKRSSRTTLETPNLSILQDSLQYSALEPMSAQASWRKVWLLPLCWGALLTGTRERSASVDLVWSTNSDPLSNPLKSNITLCLEAEAALS